MRWGVCILVIMLVAAGLAAQDSLDRGLAAMGLARNDFRIDQDSVLTRGSSRFILPMFTQWYANPLRTPFWERHLRTGLLESHGRPHAVHGTVAFNLGCGTRRDLIPPTLVEQTMPRAKREHALRDAIRALDPKAKVPATDGIPPRVQMHAALLLLVTADALHWRELALRNLSVEERKQLYTLLTTPITRPAKKEKADAKQDDDAPAFPSAYADFYRQTELLARIDQPLLHAAADDLTAALDTVWSELQKTPVTETYTFTCHTRYGEIRLSGGSDDTYTSDTHRLLILDTSGNDTYHGGAATGSATLPIGLLLDAMGNDHYEVDESRPAFGAGILGWGLLADLAGDDTYTTAGGYAEGCGIAGVGLLADAGGADQYRAIGNAQGFGFFGIGILSDIAGDDTYDAYSYGQGCGVPQGFGLLIDLAGNDRYTANDTDIIFPSAQSKEHNISMCQGAGCGERRDYVDAHSLAGGIGMLLDGKGDDQYSGGVFSQAVGYWYGIGILDDRLGNDQYRSVWYGQSATAHFAFSMLVDGGGNDYYTSSMWVTTGSAHDFSASLFLEEGGDDTYEQKGSALGQALNCSVALFADFAGNDTYKTPYGSAYGQAVNHSNTGLRAEIPSIGLFLDLAGTDTYPGAPVENKKTWLQEVKAPQPALRGAGLDEEHGEIRW